MGKIQDEDGAIGLVPITTQIGAEPALEAIQPVEQNNNVRPACFKNTFQEIMFVLTATMAIAMGSVLGGSITVTSSLIAADLKMTTAELTWVTASSSLAGGAFLLFFGRVADLFGRKSMFVASLFLFSVFALVAGFAKTPISLDVINGVMGLTSASTIPPAVGLLGVIYEKPSKRKNAAFACFSAGNPLGFVFGTMFGGISASLFNWRAAFWLQAIIFLIFTLIGLWAIPRDTAATEPFNMETLKRFDLVGVFCVVFGIGMVSAALSLAETAPHGWSTDYVLALLIIGLLLMVGFVFWDTYFKYPLVPMKIWKDRNFTLVLVILMLGDMAFSPGSFFISLFMQNVLHLSPINVAVRLLPMVVMGLAANVFAGLVLHRISNKKLMLTGALAYTIATVLLVLNRPDSSYWAFCFPSFTLFVIGADLQFNVANMYVMSSMPASQQSVAGGIFQTASKICVTVGFGVCTAIFNSVEEKPSLSGFWEVTTQPYTATFLFGVASSALGLALVPLLNIGTQGGEKKD